MTRDHLLGFPPVLLAQDDQMPCSDEGPHFPLGIPESAYTDYKSRPEYKRTRELMAFEMIPARPEITEADCRQRDWLDTSREFKVGDLVRYRPGACGSDVELAEMVFTVAALETQDGKPALRFSDGEYDYSEDLEHA